MENEMKQKLTKGIRTDLLSNCSTKQHYEAISDYLEEDIKEIVNTVENIIETPTSKEQEDLEIAEHVPDKDVDTLMEVARILQEYPDQDDQRIQEENHSMFWLMKAVNNGLSKTIDEYFKEIKNLYT